MDAVQQRGMDKLKFIDNKVNIFRIYNMKRKVHQLQPVLSEGDKIYIWIYVMQGLRQDIVLQGLLCAPLSQVSGF